MIRTRVIIPLLLTIFSISCSVGGTNDDDGISSINLGAFVGELQVVDQPQTNLGFISNAQVNFEKIDDVFIMRIAGDDGFDRVYEGKITGEGANSSFLLALEKQLSPEEKIANGALSIANNRASVEVILENEELTVKKIDAFGEIITLDLSGTIRIGGVLDKIQ